MSTETEATPLSKQVFVRDLRAKDVVRSSFLVRSKDLLVSKKGDPYLALILADRTGEIETRIWDSADQLAATFQEGDVVVVSGKAHVFQNRLQLMVDQLVAVPPGEVQLADYMVTADADLEALYGDLLAIFAGLQNPWVRQLGLLLLEDPEIARRYKICPAAKTIHHAYIGGLLTHSLQLIRLAQVVAPFYPAIDAEILIFGAAFHDFGKIYELSYQNGFSYSDEGRLVGHIAIGVTLLDRKMALLPGFPQELEWHLKHLVLSHHGRLEYGSPKRPATLEAQLLHSLDDMDSKMESIESFMKADRGGGRWTGHHKAYDQYYCKPDALRSTE